MLRYLKPAAVALGLLAGPASAATIEVVWTGTVYWDADGDSTDLTGEAITATLIYDTELGALYTTYYYQQLYGGSAWGIDDPLVSGSVVAGDEAFDPDGDYYNYLGAIDIDAADFGYDYDQYDTSLYDESGYGTDTYSVSLFYAYLYGYEEFLPDDLETAFAVTDMTGLTGYGCTYDITYTAQYDQDGNIIGYYAETYDTYVCFTVDSLTVTVLNDVAPVPLPASALLLIGAAGALGALRLRRRKS